MGRDVVGFLTKARHQGEWHNYQCKQYGRTLPTASALLELGKILYHADRGEFALPTRYSFVAPRGMNRNLERMIFNPTELRDTMNCLSRPGWRGEAKHRGSARADREA